MLSFRATCQERFTRAKTVGDNYTEERIRQRIAEPKTMMAPKWLKPSIVNIIDHSDEKICHAEDCATKRFRLEYHYEGAKPGTDAKIIAMAANASGIRDTARVLKISTDKVMDP